MNQPVSAPIRLLHFADLRLGQERYGGRSGGGIGGRTADTLRQLDSLIEAARATPPDLILFAGNAFRSAQPDPTLLGAFAERALALAEIAPLVLLVGRNDAPTANERASSLAIFATLAVPGVLVCDAFAVQRIETGRGPLTLASAPYLPQRDDLAERLTTLAREASTSAGPRVLLAHLWLAEAEGGHEENQAEQAIPLRQLAATDWDYLALGGSHHHQALTAAKAPALYPGSLERLDFSAETVVKGYIRAEVWRGGAEWQFVEVAARPFITVAADLREASEPLLAFRDALNGRQVKGAVARPQLRLTREQDAALPERALRQLMRAAGAEHVAASRRELSGPLTTRLQDGDGQPPQLLARYLELRGEERGQPFAATEKDALMAAARDIWAEVETEP